MLSIEIKNISATNLVSNHQRLLKNWSSWIFVQKNPIFNLFSPRKQKKNSYDSNKLIPQVKKKNTKSNIKNSLNHDLYFFSADIEPPNTLMTLISLRDKCLDTKFCNLFKQNRFN
jgi:hypothetical protein